MPQERCPYQSIGLGCPARKAIIVDNELVPICDVSAFVTSTKYQNSPPRGCTKEVNSAPSASPYIELARMLRR